MSGAGTLCLASAVRADRAVGAWQGISKADARSAASRAEQASFEILCRLGRPESYDVCHPLVSIILLPTSRTRAAYRWLGFLHALEDAGVRGRHCSLRHIQGKEIWDWHTSPGLHMPHLHQRSGLMPPVSHTCAATRRRSRLTMLGRLHPSRACLADCCWYLANEHKRVDILSMDTTGQAWPDVAARSCAWGLWHVDNAPRPQGLTAPLLHGHPWHTPSNSPNMILAQLVPGFPGRQEHAVNSRQGQGLLPPVWCPPHVKGRQTCSGEPSHGRAPICRMLPMPRTVPLPCVMFSPGRHALRCPHGDAASVRQ